MSFKNLAFVCLPISQPAYLPACRKTQFHYVQGSRFFTQYAHTIKLDIPICYYTKDLSTVPFSFLSSFNVLPPFFLYSHETYKDPFQR